VNQSIARRIRNVMATAKKTKYSKIFAVVSITVLIWVWADLAKTDEFTVPTATMSVARSANPNLWVSFNNKLSVSIEKIKLKGPTSRIDSIRRKLRDGSLVLEFFLDPETEAMDTPGEHPLAVLEFLKKSDQIQQHGLTAQSCEPKQITVNVVRLVEKSLDIRCVDESQNLIKGATVKPSQARMLVPEDWEGEKLTAKVQLTRGEIGQARLSAIEKTPYIELAAGVTREVPTPVKIMTPPAENQLIDYTITTAILGFSLSANLQGKYKVEVANLNEVISAIAIRATPQAKRAYENMRYHVILEIDDSDKDNGSAEPLRKELIYNFPAEYVRRDEIVLSKQPAVARFKLVPLATIQAPPTTAP